MLAFPVNGEKLVPGFIATAVGRAFSAHTGDGTRSVVRSGAREE